MNRRERKVLEKRLGLHKHRKNETRAAMYERWKGNAESGKRMEEDMKNLRITQAQEQEDKKVEAMINSQAEWIAKNKNIPVVDALVEAQEEYNKSKK